MAPTNDWVDLKSWSSVEIIEVVVSVGLCKGPNTHHVVGIGRFEKGLNTKNSMRRSGSEQVCCSRTVMIEKVVVVIVNNWYKKLVCSGFQDERSTSAFF